MAQFLLLVISKVQGPRTFFYRASYVHQASRIKLVSVRQVLLNLKKCLFRGESSSDLKKCMLPGEVHNSTPPSQKEKSV